MIYFFEDVGLASITSISQLGEKAAKLKYLEGASYQCLSGKGPDGKNGLLISIDNKGMPSPRYLKEEQEWTNFAHYYIGMEKKFQYKPEHFVRPRVFSGNDVVLGDGNTWTVPIVGPAASLCTITKEFRFGPDEVISLEVAQKFKPIFDASRKFYDYCWIGGKIQVGEIFRFCSDVLSINYFIGPSECSMLSLFNTDIWTALTEAAVGMPQILAEAESKKNSEEEPQGT